MKTLTKHITEKLKINKDFKRAKEFEYEEIKDIVDKHCVHITNIDNMFNRIEVNARDCGMSDFVQENVSKIIHSVRIFWTSYHHHFWLDIDERYMTDGMEKLKEIVEYEEQEAEAWEYIYDPRQSKNGYEFKIVYDFDYAILVCGCKNFRRIFIGIEYKKQ